MSSLRITVFALVLAFALPARAQTLWSIYWLSGPVPCDQSRPEPASLGGPLTSPYRDPCIRNGTKVSICPNFAGYGPWAQGAPITVVGYDITCAVSSPTDQCIAEIGSWAAQKDGADVFARTAGLGSNSRATMFPNGIGLPQGGPGQSYFDIYGVCGGTGPMQVLIHILYTSP